MVLVAEGVWGKIRLPAIIWRRATPPSPHSVTCHIWSLTLPVRSYPLSKQMGTAQSRCSTRASAEREHRRSPKTSGVDNSPSKRSLIRLPRVHRTRGSLPLTRAFASLVPWASWTALKIIERETKKVVVYQNVTVGGCLTSYEAPLPHSW